MTTALILNIVLSTVAVFPIVGGWRGASSATIASR
jgi:hypothetical protein